MPIGAVILLLVLFFWVGYNVGRLIEISPTPPCATATPRAASTIAAMPIRVDILEWRSTASLISLVWEGVR